MGRLKLPQRDATVPKETGRMQEMEGAADRAALTEALSVLAARLDGTDAGRAWRQLLARKDLAEFRETSTFDQVRRGLLNRLGTSTSVALAYEQVMLAVLALDAVLQPPGKPDVARSRAPTQAPPPLPAASASIREREPPRPPPRLMDALARARETADAASGRFDEADTPPPSAGRPKPAETPPPPVTGPVRLNQLEEEINRLFREPQAAPSPAANPPAIASETGEADVEEADVDIVVRADISRRDAPAIRPEERAPPSLRSARRTTSIDAGTKMTEASDPGEATVEIVRPDPTPAVQGSGRGSATAVGLAKPLPPPRKP